MNPAKKVALASALVGASIIGTAGAQTSDSSSSSATAAPQAPPNNMPAHGSAEHEAAETAVTGDNATKAQQAAVASIGSGTAGDVTTDFTGNGYEVTVTQTDGTQVEVHLDSAFAVMQHGGPGGPGGPDRPGAPAASGSSTGA